MRECDGCEQMKRNLFPIALILAILCFIWGNSALSSSISNHISDTITISFGGEITHSDEQEAAATTILTSSHIRKLAHITEFAGLGAVLTLLSVRRQKKPVHSLPGILLLGMLIALSDETIQLFTGRTSTIKDIWIDLLGFSIGCFISGITIHLITKRKSKQ